MTWLRRALWAVTPLAWSAGALSLACFLLARWLAAPAFAAMGLCLGLLIAMSAALVLLPGRADVRLRMQPARAVVGAVSVAHLEVRNRGWLPLVQSGVSLPALGDVHLAGVGVLSRHGTASSTVPLPAARRGVHLIGPAAVLRHDPLGLFRKQCGISQPVEFYVRPRTVPVDSLGVGQASDLEGIASDEISMSDLAFHALREYAPGDDLRHVHWRSSAKADRLLVRQYHDTRRSRVTVLVDTESGAFHSTREFELALSIAASVATRALQDDLEISFHCGEEGVVHGTSDEVLDAVCRAERGRVGLDAVVFRALTDGGGETPGLVVLVTGGARAEQEVRQLLSGFPRDARALVLRARAGFEPRLQVGHSFAEASVGDLDELPRAMSQFLRGGV